jgi:type I restriction enzyme M protein
MDIKEKTIALIDALKSTCQTYGMGNDGNEYKIITQVFLYKFINDKFGYAVKKISKKLNDAEKWEMEYAGMTEDERFDILDELSPDIPRLYPEHLIGNLWNQQAKGDFDLIFDSTMIDIADKNIDIFSTQTTQKTKIPLFEKLTQFVTDDAQRAPFARALVDKLVNFSFEEAFERHYDFFAGIFEYLIKDYNTSGGGKYAEYYTPNAIATIMARLLVGDSYDLHNIECYDPSAGTGTLLMALSHQIGEDRCTIFAQDISQRSNKMLKLNLILNGLVSSLDHAIQGDTLVAPYHKSDDGQSLRQFDYVVSNPPFKMDFSDTREKIAAMPARFWAGVPNVPAKKKESMAIYTCFIQHVINSLKAKGKGAIVIPTGFITAKSGVENKILRHIVDEHIVYGCISMPSNVFATTGTNVSVLFFDNSKTTDKVVLMDASKMGEEYKDGNNQKRRLRDFEIDLIVSTFQNKANVDDFSVALTYEEIKEKKYSLSAGQYFGVKIEYVELTQDEFNAKVAEYTANLQSYFDEGQKLQAAIMEQLKKVKYES